MNEGFPVARNSHCGLVAKATSSGTLTGPSDLTWPDGRQSKKAKGQSGAGRACSCSASDIIFRSRPRFVIAGGRPFLRGFSAAASLSAGSLHALGISRGRGTATPASDRHHLQPDRHRAAGAAVLPRPDRGAGSAALEEGQTTAGQWLNAYRRARICQRLACARRESLRVGFTATGSSASSKQGRSDASSE